MENARAFDHASAIGVHAVHQDDGTAVWSPPEEPASKHRSGARCDGDVFRQKDRLAALRFRQLQVAIGERRRQGSPRTARLRQPASNTQPTESQTEADDPAPNSCFPGVTAKPEYTAKIRR